MTPANSPRLSLLAENRLHVSLTGREESHLLESLHKIANRIAAALIPASALMMDASGAPCCSVIRRSHWSCSWPAPVLGWAGLGITIMLSALPGGRRARPDDQRCPH